jgi:hypothetical protein
MRLPLWIVLTVALLGLFGRPAILWAADPMHQLRQLRFLSHALRDRPPTPAEAQALYQGQATLEQVRDAWLEESDHEQRVARFFRDLLGGPNFFFVQDEAYFLKQSAQGTYYSEAKGACDEATALTRSAWWTHSPTETIRICPNIVSQNLFVMVSGTYYGCSWTDGFLRNGCGCGPEQILCFPKTTQLSLGDDLAHEFRDRAVYAYLEQLSWKDLLSSSSIYANRPMQVFYLQSQYIVPWQTAPDAASLQKLRTIPMQEKVWAPAPELGASRSGIATAPAFMKRFNNFRSRVRALSDALLCRDIDGSLNTDGIQSLVNPHVTEFDRGIVTRTPCDSCHYAMDNMGALLFGWNDQGLYQRWPQQLSQVGHVFGVRGEGPQALMDGLIDRGPGFQECMARRVWEDFSGMSWGDLPAAERQEILALAGQSPRALIRGVAQSKALLAARQGSSDESTSEANPDFAAIQPILQRSCAGSSCHSIGSTLGSRYEFIDSAGRFQQVPLARIQDGSMPPAQSGYPLSAEERDLLIRYLSP